MKLNKTKFLKVQLPAGYADTADAGMYFVRMTTNEGVVSKPFVVR